MEINTAIDDGINIDIPERFRDNTGDEMVRIKCNVCKQYKNLKLENYEKRLKNFGFTRSFLFGMTHGLEALVYGDDVKKPLSREETEKAYANVYVCDDCRNNKKETIRITQSITRILNLPQKKYPEGFNQKEEKEEKEE
jgi:hypothetical protein